MTPPALAPLAATALLCALLLAVSLIDMRTRRIPDPLNAAILIAGLGAAWFLHRDLPAALIGVAAGYLTILAVNALFRRMRGRDGVGMGDAKLLGALGAWVLWWGLPFVVLIASTAGLAVALVRRAGRDEMLPFGPFIAAGAITVWLAQRFA